MRRTAAWFVAIVTLSVGLAGHFHGHMLYLARLNLPSLGMEPPEAVGPGAGSPEALSGSELRGGGRVVVLVVDGLGWNWATRRPELMALAKRGEGHPLVAGFPSFTWPGLTTIGTGLPPEVHGVRINYDGFAAPQLESVSKVAARAGISVAFRDRDFADFSSLLALPDAARLDRDVVPDGGRSLTWFYLVDVDAAGHRYGAASPEYAAAVDTAQALALRLLGQLDLARDTLVIVSDHGHLDRGGHGGAEPEVVEATWIAVGAGVGSVGIGPAQPMTAAAPRLGALLGLDFHPRWRAPPPAETWWRTLRTMIVLLVVGAAGAYFARAQLAMRLRDFLPTLVYGATFLVGYVALGYRWSWSIPRGELGFTVETGLVALLGLAGAVVSGQRDRRIPEAWAQMLAWGLPYLGFSVYCGLDTRYPPGPWSTWGLILFATIVFYPGLVFGLRAVWTALARGEVEKGAV